MADPLTITIPEAAKRLGFPKATTERVARDHGFLIMAGNRKRIDPNDLTEIRDICRSTPKARDFTAAATPASTSSATPAGVSTQRAHEIAQKLKKPLVSTSQSATAPVDLRQRRA